MLPSSLRDKILCPRFMAPDRGPLQQSYLKEVVPLEAIIVNNNWNSKTKETKRIRKSQAFITPGVVNHHQTKLLGLNQTATTIAAKIERK